MALAGWLEGKASDVGGGIVHGATLVQPLFQKNGRQEKKSSKEDDAFVCVSQLIKARLLLILLIIT